MFKEEIVPTITIWEPNPIKSKDEVKIDEIKPDTIDIPDYRYGTSKEQLDANTSLRNASVFQVKTWNFQVPFTWNKSITWIWFTPKAITLFSTQSNGDRPITSNAVTDWTTHWCHYIYRNSSWSTSIASSFRNDRIIYLQDSLWTTEATFVSFDSDWFTINASNVYVTPDCSYIAYG